MAQALFASGSFARQPPSSLSTIEDKALTGRESCVRRQQKRGQSGNFLRRPEPLQRQSCGALTDLPSAVLPSLHIGEHITRAYCIDSDLWREFEGQCLRHFDYACFADVICHIVRNTNEPAHRGSINDDPGGGCTPHQCRGALGHEERPGEVNVEDMLPGFWCHIQARLAHADARIVEDCVDTAPLALQLLKGSDHVVVHRYIARNRDFRHARLLGYGRVAIKYSDACSRQGKPAYHGCPYSGGPTRHQDAPGCPRAHGRSGGRPPGRLADTAGSMYRVHTRWK